MEAGILELMRSIDGPMFLLLFLLLGIVMTIGAWAWVRLDGTARRPLPSYLAQDPMILAYLSGRENGVKRAVMFRLFSQGKLKMDDARGKTSRLIATEGSWSKDHLEQRVLSSMRSGRSIREYFRDSALHGEVRQALDPMVSRLGDEGLLMDRRQRAMARAKVLLLLSILLAFGGVKMYLGLKYGHPIVFLVLLMVLFTVSMALLAYRPHLTTLGRRYLRGSRDHMSWAKASTGQGTVPDGVDPVLLVALFGAGALLPVASYHDLSERTRAASTSAGCGYYVGGSDSGDGGSSGGCGGGCGGCGGGCGGGGCGGS